MDSIIEIIEEQEECIKEKKVNTLSAIKNNRIKKNKRTTSLYKSNGVLKAMASEPIKNNEDIRALINYFLEKKQYRDHLMFVLGIHVGRRAGDMLNFKIEDVYNVKTNEVASKLYIIEEKTRKSGYLYFNDQVKNAIKLYISNKYNFKTINPNDWLFWSRKKDNNGEHKLKVSSAWRILNDAARNLKLDVHVGTHIMRKIFGYKVYTECENAKEALAILQDMYHHSTPAMTLKYIGITEENKKQIMMNINY